jgi:hypothetical protein
MPYKQSKLTKKCIKGMNKSGYLKLKRLTKDPATTDSYIVYDTVHFNTQGIENPNPNPFVPEGDDKTLIGIMSLNDYLDIDDGKFKMKNIYSLELKESINDVIRLYNSQERGDDDNIKEMLTQVSLLIKDKKLLFQEKALNRLCAYSGQERTPESKKNSSVCFGIKKIKDKGICVIDFMVNLVRNILSFFEFTQEIKEDLNLPSNSIHITNYNTIYTLFIGAISLSGATPRPRSLTPKSKSKSTKSPSNKSFNLSRDLSNASTNVNPGRGQTSTTKKSLKQIKSAVKSNRTTTLYDGFPASSSNQFFTAPPNNSLLRKEGRSASSSNQFFTAPPNNSLLRKEGKSASTSDGFNISGEVSAGRKLKKKKGKPCSVKARK